MSRYRLTGGSLQLITRRSASPDRDIDIKRSKMGSRSGNESTQEESDPEPPKLVPMAPEQPKVKEHKLESTASTIKPKKYSPDDEYEVEEILERRQVRKKVQYKIKWVGWSLVDCTWEPPENLKSVQYMIDEFERKRAAEKSNKKRPRASSSSKKKSPRELLEGEPAKKTQKTSSTDPSRRRLPRNPPSEIDEDLHKSLLDSSQQRRSSSVANVGRYAETETSDEEVTTTPKKPPGKRAKSTGGASRYAESTVSENPPRRSGRNSDETEEPEEAKAPPAKPKPTILKVKIGPKSKMEAMERKRREQEAEANAAAQEGTETASPQYVQTWKKIVDPNAACGTPSKREASSSATAAAATTPEDQASERSFHSAASRAVPNSPKSVGEVDFVEIASVRKHPVTRGALQYLVELKDFSRVWVDEDIVDKKHTGLGLAYWSKVMKAKIEEQDCADSGGLVNLSHEQ